MKKNVNTTPGNRKTSQSAGQARLQAGEPNAKKSDVTVSTVTFKEGLRCMNLKYARAHSAYTPLCIWCETALAPVAGLWLAVCTGSKHANMCLTGCSIRTIRNTLEHCIGDEELLYVMNAYIYGVINTASLADALLVTHDYEKYITGNTTLTALQRETLLQGFAVAKYSIKFWDEAW